MAVGFMQSCKKDFTKINTDPNNIPDAVPQQLLAPALVNTVGYGMRRNWNFNNELMQITVSRGDTEGKVFRYEIRNNWSDYLYNGLYVELTNFKDLYRIASNEVNNNPSYMGIALIMQCYSYAILTDTYGDMPYFQANEGREKVFEPKFDAQMLIYLDMFKKLEEANTLLKAGKAIQGGVYDPVYSGDVAKWRKFGNSLYLRLLLRIAAKPEVNDQCKQKIKEIVETKAADYPKMANNNDSAILRWTGIPPYTSPLLDIRDDSFRNPAICSFFIDNLTRWNDPVLNRSNSNYATNGVNRWRIAPYETEYLGISSGYKPGTDPAKRSYFYSRGQTVSGAEAATMQKEPLAGMMMNYAELQLILAECALRGYISDTNIETYYNTGAQSRITLWLPNWTDPIATFLANGGVKWDNNLDFEAKMELIHLQKYYALFCTDLQQWFEYRRTGHPKLPKGEGLANNGVMPARMVYPVYVQSANPTNYKAAVAAQGPDLISTEVWWQKQ